MKCSALVVCLGLAGLALPATAQRPTCASDNGGLTLPAGFCASVIADSIGNVRHLAVAPNGDVFAAVAGQRGGAGALLLLRDADGDGRFETRRRLWETGGTGVALRDESLYFATNDAVLRFRIPSGTLATAGPPDTIVRELPVGGHAAKSIALGRDDALYVNVGSRTNSCQQQDRQNRSPGQEPCAELESRAGIWRFSATRTNQRQADGVRFATGLRNVVALTVHPGSGEVYGAQHGRDMLAQNWGFTVEASAELPSEELVHIPEGGDFGWPYCYHDHLQGKRVLAPEYGGDGREVGQCSGKQQPLVAFPGHWAPNGLTFYARDQFPERYRGGAFIAFHGSWNRAPLPQAGFKVVFQPFAGAEPNGPHEVFADGFRGVNARPTGLAVGPDGSLFISADSGQRIWRVQYRAQP